jgi:16S rRNA (guanine527-N7)-methyltransferase
MSAPAFPPAARAALEAGAARLGLALTPEQLDSFGAYAALLETGRAEANLTALSDPLDVALKHFLDSLTVLLALPTAASPLVDVGTGAGFPGVPLKIARPALDVTLIEATAKKASWLERATAQLGLTGVHVAHGRAEELGHDRRFRGRFAAAAARAVAPLPVLCELCLPFLRPGGLFIAQKSIQGAEAELPRAERALSLLGAHLVERRPVALTSPPNRVLIVIQQQHPAPERYPRRPGMPAKNPL